MISARIFIANRRFWAIQEDGSLEQVTSGRPGRYFEALARRYPGTERLGHSPHRH